MGHIGQNGKPLAGELELTKKQRAVVEQFKSRIRSVLGKIARRANQIEDYYQELRRQAQSGGRGGAGTGMMLLCDPSEFVDLTFFAWYDYAHGLPKGTSLRRAMLEAMYDGQILIFPGILNPATNDTDGDGIFDG
jgi:hypothetical protein